MFLSNSVNTLHSKSLMPNDSSSQNDWRMLSRLLIEEPWVVTSELCTVNKLVEQGSLATVGAGPDKTHPNLVWIVTGLVSPLHVWPIVKAQ